MALMKISRKWSRNVETHAIDEKKSLCAFLGQPSTLAEGKYSCMLIHCIGLSLHDRERRLLNCAAHLFRLPLLATPVLGNHKLWQRPFWANKRNWTKTFFRDSMRLTRLCRATCFQPLMCRSPRVSTLERISSRHHRRLFTRTPSSGSSSRCLTLNLWAQQPIPSLCPNSCTLTIPGLTVTSSSHLGPQVRPACRCQTH